MMLREARPYGRASARPAIRVGPLSPRPDRLEHGAMSDTLVQSGVDAAIAIELRDIVKRFPGVVANDGVNLTVRSGSIHAIVGENGAGKSTLMKTLYGAHRPDEGTIRVNGVEQALQVAPRRDRGRDRHGVPALPVGRQPDGVGEHRARRRTGHEVAARLRARPARQFASSATGTASTSTPTRWSATSVWARSSASRSSRCCIAAPRSSSSTSRPPCSYRRRSTSCSPRSRELTAAGATAIFISHKLDEVLAHADAITVIRAGKTVGEVPDPSTVTAHDLAEMMVGSELPSPATRESTVTDEVALEVRRDPRRRRRHCRNRGGAAARRRVDHDPSRRGRRHRRRGRQRPVRIGRTPCSA